MSTAAGPAAPFGPDLRAALVAMVRKRVPDSEVEDIVQQALAEAIESPHAPQDSESLRRWIFGVAKHKVVDYHRRAGRLSFELPDVAGEPAPHAEADLLRWAERNLPEGAENKKTLDWMLREGEGEKLESIAASEKLPPPRVRQRVSRLRRHFKENWQREVAMLAALGVIISAVVVFILKKNEPEPITHEGPTILEPRADGIRRAALERCAASDWKKCVEGLDEARGLDPAGDSKPEVRKARKDAADAVTVPDTSPVPTTSAPPAKPAPKKTAPAKPQSTESFLEAPTPAPPAPRAMKSDSSFEAKPNGNSVTTAAPPASKKSAPTKTGGGLGDFTSDSSGSSTK